MTALGRRSILVGGAAVVVAVPAVASTVPAEPDAELVRLCRKAVECEAHADALTMAVNDVLLSDPRWVAAFAEARLLMDRYNLAVERAEQIPARTTAGLRAKAELVRVHMHPDQDDFGVLHSLLRDLAKVAG